jgi:hypothetical protein
MVGDVGIEPTLNLRVKQAFNRRSCPPLKWSLRQVSNLRPKPYQDFALPAELRKDIGVINGTRTRIDAFTGRDLNQLEDNHHRKGRWNPSRTGISRSSDARNRTVSAIQRLFHS